MKSESPDTLTECKSGVTCDRESLSSSSYTLNEFQQTEHLKQTSETQKQTCKHLLSTYLTFKPGGADVHVKYAVKKAEYEMAWG